MPNPKPIGVLVDHNAGVISVTHPFRGIVDAVLLHAGVTSLLVSWVGLEACSL
ncbi:MAG: hypothetical protein WCJ66_00605 [Verrucomicrobiota bacterium]